MLLRSALRRVDRDVDCNAAWTASSFITVTGEARVTSRFYFPAGTARSSATHLQGEREKCLIFDPIDGFQDTIKKCGDTGCKAEGLATFAVEVGQVLQDWKDFPFSNLNISFTGTAQANKHWRPMAYKPGDSKGHL